MVEDKKDSEDEIVVKTQKMFPNCSKYEPCCSDDIKFRCFHCGEQFQDETALQKHLKTHGEK